jgi:hypothetical protein
VLKYLPGVLGFLFLVTAAALIYVPAAFAVAGVLLLAVDRRIG